MELPDVLKDAELTVKDVTERLAEIALFPDDLDCPIWMVWDIPAASELRGIFRQCRKKKGTNRGDLDEDKAAEKLIERCFKSIHGLSVNVICEYGLFALNYNAKLKMIAATCDTSLEKLQSMTEKEVEELGNKDWGSSGMPTARLLLDRSNSFRGRCASFIEVASVQEAEEALRKKRSAVTFTTED